MFQVAASHPAGFAKAYPYPSSHHQAAPMHSVPAPSNAVKLPRTLSRPPFAEVSRDAIAAVAPELASVPSEYIRRGLRTQAKDMLSGLSSVSSSHVPSSMPRSRLPSALTVPVRPGSNPGMVPTHVLAVSSSTAHSDSVSVFPIHALLLAAVCTKLPRLPATAPAGSSATLPVLPLSLPSPAAFSLLHSWLYNPTPATILRSLVPMPSSFIANLTDSDVRAALSNGQTLHSLAAYLVSASASGKGSAHTLTSHAAHVKELWQDVVALGIHDPDLWGILDLAWEVVLGALNLAATQNH